ncbi:MAG: hypothetical protein A3D94_12815 [Alphaproteobacteria bacterium RIFCSPHIGHO2_12_FULL_66_14]|nr:MAG: hypothetical protein A3D94_12815 [Alphaproteobacteria bacterium RIFCSPHIGHO2_12_FULL_66_14]
MNKQLACASLFAACGLALASCTLEKPETSVAPNYQAPAPAIVAPANIRAVCYSAADLDTYRVRNVQQQLAVGVLSCKAADGSRRLTQQYVAFLDKFNPELATNAVELRSLVARKRLNVDVLVTEIANRTASRPSHDAAFCSRHERAFAWALTPEVTSLAQVPSPYDFGPEMKVFPCPRS